MFSFLGAMALVPGIMGGAPGLAQPRGDSGDAYGAAVQIYVKTGDISQAVAGIHTWSIARWCNPSSRRTRRRL